MLSSPPSQLHIAFAALGEDPAEPSPPTELEETKETRALMRELRLGSVDPLSPHAMLSPAAAMSELADPDAAGFGQLRGPPVSRDASTSRDTGAPVRTKFREDTRPAASSALCMEVKSHSAVTSMPSA